MQTLAVLFRSAQFQTHQGHNLASGPTFFADHEFLGELYAAYESAYDSVIERMIGLGMEVDIGNITRKAAEYAAKYAFHDTQSCFVDLYQTEQELCAQIAKEVVGASDGTQNLLQGLADESEVRQYKLGQRIRK